MNLEISPNSVLLLIDFQQGFDDPSWGERNNPAAEQRAKDLLKAWREADRPLVHIRHDSQEAESPLQRTRGGFAFKSEVAPNEDERLAVKRVNSAFVGTNLQMWLEEHGYERLVLTGFTTDHCVSTTAQMAENLGFRVIVITDATATFERETPTGRAVPADENHWVALAQLRGEFATVADTEQVLTQTMNGPTEA